MINKIDGPWSFEQIDLGLNYRMTDLEASLGISQLNRLDQFVEKRRKIAFIMLRTNAPAQICLDNKHYFNSEQLLRGFEWSVYTIENNRIERLYIADSWKQAKKWCVKEGYDFIDDDPSKQLCESLTDLNK